MSWAAIAKKAQDIEQPTLLPTPETQVVLAPVDDARDDLVVTYNTTGDLENAHRRTVLNLPQFNKGLLVLDANAFIKGMDNLLNVADCVVTVSQVVSEVRDRAARGVLERLPFQLHVLEPSKESIVEVMSMASKTGDDGTMSRTDIRLCALALDCCIAQGCLGTRIEPRAPVLNPDSIQTNEEEVDDEEDEEEEEEGEEENEEENAAEGGEPSTGVSASVSATTTAPPATTPATTTKQPESTKDTKPVIPTTGAEDDWGADDGNGEWITPANIAKVIHGTAIQNGATDFTGGVAAVTSDFAMQNTLMHLGVPIVGPRGMRIRELRLWLLRCHACYRIVTDTTKQFCPDCGSGDTLRRVNYVVHDDGQKELFINFKRQISTRGTIFNLPKPRGGRKGTNRLLVLREDQLAHVLRGKQTAASREAKVRSCLADDDDEAELGTFGLAGARKKRDINAAKETSSYHRYNINERKKAKAGRRK